MRVRSLLLAAALAGADAHAQTVALGTAGTESHFFRNRNVSVREREQPGYDPLGWRLGGFLLFPQLTLAAEYDSNVFASRTDRRDDLQFQVEPQIRLVSNWARHAFGAYARVSRREYLTYSSESSTDWQVGADGMLEAGRTRFSAGADYARLVEPRTATNTAREAERRIRYDQAFGFVAAQREVSRFRLSARAEARAYDYRNARTGAGAVTLEDNRDHSILIFTGRADYALTPAVAAYVSGSYNQRDYDLAPPTVTVERDSDGYEVVGGLDFDLSALLRGQVQAGYFRQSYDDPLLGRPSGFAALGQVEWFPTQLTTVALTGSRRIEDSGLEETPVYISTSVGVRVDHELLRNLILNAGIDYIDDNYQGVDRRDRRYAATAGADYRMNRTLGLRLRYDYLDQNSRGAERAAAFTVHRVLLSVVLRR